MLVSAQDRILSLTHDIQIQAQAKGGIPWWLSGGIAAANCVAAYQAKGAVSLAASYVNLNSPGTHDAFLGTTPGWDAVNGWIGDGSAYLKTDIVPTSSYSAICRFSSATGSSTSLFGEFDTGAAFSIQPRRGGTTVRYYSGALLGVSPQLDSGVLAVSNQQGYRNGSADGGTISAWTGTATHPIYLLSTFSLGTTIFVGNIQAIAFYSIDISAQISALTLAMNAL